MSVFAWSSLASGPRVALAAAAARRQPDLRLWAAVPTSCHWPDSLWKPPEARRQSSMALGAARANHALVRCRRRDARACRDARPDRPPGHAKRVVMLAGRRATARPGRPIIDGEGGASGWGRRAARALSPRQATGLGSCKRRPDTHSLASLAHLSRPGSRARAATHRETHSGGSPSELPSDGRRQSRAPLVIANYRSSCDICPWPNAEPVRAAACARPGAGKGPKARPMRQQRPRRGRTARPETTFSRTPGPNRMPIKWTDSLQLSA